MSFRRGLWVGILLHLTSSYARPSSSVSLCVPSVPSGLYPASSFFPLLQYCSFFFSDVIFMFYIPASSWGPPRLVPTRGGFACVTFPSQSTQHALTVAAGGLLQCLSMAAGAGASALVVWHSRLHILAVFNFPTLLPSVHTPCSGQTSLFTWLPPLTPRPTRFPSERPLHSLFSESLLLHG